MRKLFTVTLAGIVFLVLFVLGLHTPRETAAQYKLSETTLTEGDTDEGITAAVQAEVKDTAAAHENPASGDDSKGDAFRSTTEETAQTGSNPTDEWIPQIDTSVSVHKGARIAVIGKNRKGEFWKLVQKGMKKAVSDINAAYDFSKDEQLKMTYEGPSSEEDIEAQINTFDAVLSENPDVVCLSAIDMNSCLAQLEMAYENKIPVIAFDSNVSESDLVTAFRASDNYEIGRQGAYRLALALGKKGKVVVLSISGKGQSLLERVRGFNDCIREYKEIEVLEPVYIEKASETEKMITTLFEENPDLKGVFCTNADISDNFLALDIVKQAQDLAIVGVDATRRQQEAIRSGRETGCVSQHPYAIGYQAIWAAAEATAPPERRKIPEQILITPAWICAENIDDPVLSDYLY
ncbi:MAG: substrate-binding domain-containing protein [Blautia sp.]|nr:substrate-binding domain-containing protein [Blautia sp.]